MSLLSAAYGGAIALRNRFYDQGVFKTRALAGPVISVGNISVGGTGKTPFVIYLGELLRQRGIAFDVLSRGYGRKTRGVSLVRPEGSAQDFGDEPVLIARRLGAPVVVGENRYRAGVVAERLFGRKLHLLDDGFQHRRLARDFDIVLLTAEDVSDRLLPRGRLREPLASLERADALVFTGELSPAALPVRKRALWRAERSLSVSQPPRPALVFCGIARPRQFLDQLKRAGIEVIGERFYRDHHAYTEQDVRELVAWREQLQGEGFITTEKDALNLGSGLGKLGRVSVARLTMTLSEPADALNTMLGIIRERHPAHEKILMSAHSQ